MSVVALRKLKSADMRVEAHTGKPPFATIRNDFAVMRRIINGERPCWPEAPAQGYDVSASVKELSENCWNSDPARRPTAQAIVKALALETSHNVLISQVQQSLSMTSSVSVSASQESSKKPTSSKYGAFTQEHVSATAAAGHKVNGGFGTSKLLKRFTIY
jgi:hypothetical protein